MTPHFLILNVCTQDEALIKAAGGSRLSISHCPGCHWAQEGYPCCTATATTTAMKDVTVKHFFFLLLLSLCRGSKVQSVPLCNTRSSNHDSSRTPNLRSCNWKEAIPRYFAETREHQRAKMTGMLKRTVKGLELVQIKTPFQEMFLPLLGTLEIPLLLKTHTPYENSEITRDLPSQQPFLTSSEL